MKKSIVNILMLFFRAECDKFPNSKPIKEINYNIKSSLIKTNILRLFFFTFILKKCSKFTVKKIDDRLNSFFSLFLQLILINISCRYGNFYSNNSLNVWGNNLCFTSSFNL